MSSISVPTYREFLRVMSSGMSANERLVIDIVKGDPGVQENMVRSDRKYMRPRDDDSWAALELPGDRNLYLCVMCVLEGVHNRRSENFNGGLALMVDDVGDVSKARGIKVPTDIIGALKPTALVETSEGNFQAWYRLTRPLRDKDLFDRIIRAFIREKLMGKDPGQGGIARIARIPYGVNGKPSRNGWKVRLAALNEDVSYTPAELIRAFRLVLDPPREAATQADAPSAEVWKYKFMKEHLESADHRNADLEARRGEWKVVCPNVGSHSNGVRSGTFIMPPGRNRHGVPYAIFKCAHTSCSDMKPRDAIRLICQDDPQAAEEWRAYWAANDDQIARDLKDANDADVLGVRK